MSAEEVFQRLPHLTQYRWHRDSYTDQVAYDNMIAARSRLIIRHPFFGIIAVSLVLVEAKEIPTLATDGFHLFYNPKFLMQLRPGERDFGVAHEVVHVVWKHTGRTRRGGRDPLVWNYAIDYVTNRMVQEMRIGEVITTIKILLDEQYDGMAAEAIYDLLEKNPDSMNGEGQFDIHIGVGSGDGQEGSVSQDGEATRVDIPQDVYDRVNRTAEDVILQARAAQHEHDLKRNAGASSLPGSLLAYLDGLVEPRIDWRQVLRYYCSQLISYGYSYARPNKALFSQGWTIPGFRTRTDHIVLCIGVDRSGSIGLEQLTVFVSEIKEIVSVFEKFILHIWCFSDIVYEESAMIITEENIADLDSFSLIGGGGTLFESNWTYMQEIEVRPDLFLMFTDGEPYAGNWGDPTYCDTLFLIHGSRNRPPFGVAAYYED